MWKGNEITSILYSLGMIALKKYIFIHVWFLIHNIQFDRKFRNTFIIWSWMKENWLNFPLKIFQFFPFSYQAPTTRIDFLSQKFSSSLIHIENPKSHFNVQNHAENVETNYIDLNNLHTKKIFNNSVKFLILSNHYLWFWTIWVA